MAEQPPITRFSFPALSSQDPALPLKENLESKWGHGLLEARSEVSGCVLPSEHLFFVKGLAASFPGQGLQSSLESLPGGLLSSPQEALGWEQLQLKRVQVLPQGCSQAECFFQPYSAQRVGQLPRTYTPTLPEALNSGFSGMPTIRSH